MKLAYNGKAKDEIFAVVEKFLSYRYLNLYPRDCKMFQLKAGFLYAQVPLKISSVVLNSICFQSYLGCIVKARHASKTDIWYFPHSCVVYWYFDLKCPFSNHTHITSHFNCERTQSVSLNNFLFNGITHFVLICIMSSNKFYILKTNTL